MAGLGRRPTGEIRGSRAAGARRVPVGVVLAIGSVMSLIPYAMALSAEPRGGPCDGSLYAITAVIEAGAGAFAVLFIVVVGYVVDRYEREK